MNISRYRYGRKQKGFCDANPLVQDGVSDMRRRAFDVAKSSIGLESVETKFLVLKMYQTVKCKNTDLWMKLANSISWNVEE